MDNNRSKAFSAIIMVIGTLLAISLAVNAFLMLERSRIFNEQSEYVRYHINPLLGDMNMLQEQLKYGKRINWSDANNLWGIAMTIKDAELHVHAVVNMTGCLDQSLAGDIIDSGLPDFWPDLSQSYVDFNNAAFNRTKGDEVDTKRLEIFNNKMGRASFPNQGTFTWQKLESGINQYLNRVDIRGEITKATTDAGHVSTILVEGTLEKDTSYDRAHIRITDKTEIYKGTARSSVSANDLREGLQVEVTFTGPVDESYPVQATAQVIRIIN